MIEPRHPDIIIREINELNRVIEHSQEMIRSFPNDKLLPIALFDTKSEELIQIFSEAAPEDRRKAYNLLVTFDPTKTDNYKKLMR